MVARLRRISGSSSMMRIVFFMNLSGWGKGDLDGEGGAAAFEALDGNGAAMQLHALLHDHQAEAGAGCLADIRAAAERFEEAGEVLLRDANALVADTEEQRAILTDGAEGHRGTIGRI